MNSGTFANSSHKLSKLNKNDFTKMLAFVLTPLWPDHFPCGILVDGIVADRPVVLRVGALMVKHNPTLPLAHDLEEGAEQRGIWHLHQL